MRPEDYLIFYLFYVAYLYNFCNSFDVYIVKYPTSGLGISRLTGLTSHAGFLAGNKVRSGWSE